MSAVSRRFFTARGIWRISRTTISGATAREWTSTGSTLPDDEYDRFVEFMQDKDVEVESQTQRTVDELRRQAEREKYLDRISGELEAIERKLKDDKNADLQAFREDIRKLLESEIVMRYHYYAGVARHSALRDRGGAGRRRAARRHGPLPPDTLATGHRAQISPAHEKRTRISPLFVP